MRNSWLGIKKRFKLKSLDDVDQNMQNNLFYLLTMILIMMGLFVEYAYYSTIGHLGSSIASEILGIHISKFIFILVFSVLIDWILSSMIRKKILSFKEWKPDYFKRSPLLFIMILILMLSFDTPVSVLGLSTVVMILFSFTQKLKFVHPVLIGYFLAVLGVFSLNESFGIFSTPPMFSAPLMTVIENPILLSYEEFIFKFHSIPNLLVGMFEGSLAVTLILPLCLCLIFLLKRRIIDIKSISIYLGIYFSFFALCVPLHHLEGWILGLIFLNGGIFICPMFLLPNIRDSFESSFWFDTYVIGLSILTFILTYSYHFVFGPYVALGVSQVLLEAVRSVYRFYVSDKSLSSKMS